MSNHRRILFIVVLLLAGISACSGGPSKPTVEIISPPSGTQVTLGEQVEVEYRATDDTAVVRVELEVNGQIVDSQNSPVAEGQPSLSGMLRWTPTEDGTYALIVYAYNRDRMVSDPVGVNIIVGEGGPAPDSTVTVGLILPGATETAPGISTRPPSAPTSTQPPSAPTSTRPPAAPTATRPPAAPTATQRPPAPTATQPPPAPTATQPPPPARIEMRNRSGEDVYWVHFDSPYHSFADDQLGSDIVGPGQDYNWNVLSGTYHLQAVASDGYVLDERLSEDVHGHYIWRISPRPQVPARIELINNSGEEIYWVHFDSPHHSFADDQLGSDIVGAGQNYNWNVLAGTYRLQAVASDGYVLDDRSSVDVHGHYQWVIPQTRQPQVSRLVVVNECVEPIVYLYTDAYPGVNLVEDGAMFERESRVFDVPPGIWSFVARDQWDQMLDGGQAQFDPGSDVYFYACG